MKQYKRGLCIVHLDRLKQNIQSYHEILPMGTKMIAILKTDAYGHGSVYSAKALDDLDYVWGYGVATAEEGVQLRKNGIKKRILLLGICFEEDFEELIRYDITPCICSLDYAKKLSAIAVSMGKEPIVHIKLDTGMGRIGFDATLDTTRDPVKMQATIEDILEVAKCPNLVIEGIFSHFAKADDRDRSFCKQQLEAFETTVSALEARGLPIPKQHIANSAAITEFKPSVDKPLVRLGISLYGMKPSDVVKQEGVTIRPVMELKSTVSFVKTVSDDTPISYGGTYRADGTRQIATVPIGYGDGYSRLLSNKADVLIHGKRYPIVGRICMDQFMVDVTGGTVAPGDTVTLVGCDGNEEISFEELGHLSGRFNYEFACDISKRIPRLYVDGDTIVGHTDYLES